MIFYELEDIYAYELSNLLSVTAGSQVSYF